MIKVFFKHIFSMLKNPKFIILTVLILSTLFIIGMFKFSDAVLAADQSQVGMTTPAIVTPPNPAQNTTASLKPPTIDTGDTTWVLVSSALVLLMTFGLALFYGGMVRSKNVLSTVMQSFIAISVVSAVWVLYGYSMSFGPDMNHLIGNLTWSGLRGVGQAPNPDYAATIPHEAFMLFQMMFAIITPALITGAFAERFKFRTYLVFLVFWITFVYCPVAHWVWGVGGWLRNFGTLDFAGGYVVHISSGAAALAASFIVGRRKGYGAEAIPPHNLIFTITGTGLLWFGWFGFNGGSAITSGALATSAIVVTHIAASFAALSWIFAEWVHRGKPTALGAVSGAVAGLATITPAAGFVNLTASIIIGLIAGILCYLAVNLKTKFGYDDSLDVVGVHGVGSTWGVIATGLFATTAVNSLGNNGLFYGNPNLLFIQFITALVVWAYSFGVTFIIMKVLDIIMGLRVTDEEESIGLDLSQHGERSYTI